MCARRVYECRLQSCGEVNMIGIEWLANICGDCNRFGKGMTMTTMAIIFRRKLFTSLRSGKHRLGLSSEISVHRACSLFLHWSGVDKIDTIEVNFGQSWIRIFRFVVTIRKLVRTECDGACVYVCLSVAKYQVFSLQFSIIRHVISHKIYIRP